MCPLAPTIYTLTEKTSFCLSVIDLGGNRNQVLAEEIWEVYWDLSLEKNLEEGVLIGLFAVLSVCSYGEQPPSHHHRRDSPKESASHGGWSSERRKEAGHSRTSVRGWINLLWGCPTSGFLTQDPLLIALLPTWSLPLIAVFHFLNISALFNSY